MNSLNEEQKKAVETTEGRVLILAGAGSGKTKVLTYRIAHLIKNKGVDPTQILGLTFTNKAANEMKERVAHLVEREQAKQVMLSTFHSFCLYVLRREIDKLGYSRNFSLYDEKDIKRMVKSLTHDTLEQDDSLPSLEETLARIIHAKSRGEPPAPTGRKWHDDFVSDLYVKLKASMLAYNAVDFDTLQTLTVELFEKFPEVLAKYQKRFRYIMIDEYQDTSPIQYKLASLLAQGHNNLCVVGDDDQSIYSWRGAEVKHILDFKSDLLVKLEQNYRSTPTILEGANAVISHNTERHDKALWSKKEMGEKIELFHAPTEMDEAEAVVEKAISFIEEGYKWSDIAILYRSNAIARSIELALMQAVYKDDKESWVRGVPYQVFGGLEMGERSEIKDVMAYLRAVANPKDQEGILRILNTPRRGISEATVGKLTQHSRMHNLPLWNVLKNAQEYVPDLTSRALAGIEQFCSIIEEGKELFSQNNFSAAYKTFIEKTNMRKAIEEEVKSDKMRQFKWENVLSCSEALSSYEKEMEEAHEEKTLAHFLTHTLLNKDTLQRKEKKMGHNHITLSTFHSAKGLEFPVCFLVALEDHILPHERSVREGSIEEERRLLYVAMTRAKKRLFLSMARKRKKFGREVRTTPSRFLHEIPKDLLNISSHQFL